MDEVKNTQEKVTCPCGQVFESTALLIGSRKIAESKYCHDCVSRLQKERDADAAAERQAVLEERWNNFTRDMPIYAEPFDKKLCVHGCVALWKQRQADKNVKVSKAEEAAEAGRVLSCVDNAIEKLSAWNYRKGHGIGLIGHSGSAKTRMVFAYVLKPLIFSGVRVEFQTSTGFAHEVSARFGENSRDAHSWLERLIKAPVLVLDDLGKESYGRDPSASKVEESLFHLVRCRTDALRPIIFTANRNGADLIKSMSSDRGGPLVRRLRQFCEGITL